MPTIDYFLATSRHPIDDRHPLWRQPLPTRRLGGAAGKPAPPKDEPFSYGSYFQAVVRFCEASGWRRLLLAASQRLAKPITEQDLQHVSIYLEKHGAFYHPARLALTVDGQSLSMVVNVATSRLGKQALLQETHALERLNKEHPFEWFPAVYAIEDKTPPMFLGDWFDGFHEFHLTREKEVDELKMVVWDGSDSPHLISDEQGAEVYRAMAMILAACYDPVTTCQIFPWHHAAGDFVVRLEEENVSVKLITVRNYAPLTDSSTGPADEKELLETLLLFFLHLSVRMRLDRLDGVSEVVWAPESCLVPTLEGFFRGLDLAARLNGFPEAFPGHFQQYVTHWRIENLAALAGQIMKTVFDPRSDERQVIEDHLDRHVESVLRIVASGPAGRIAGNLDP